MIFQEQDIFEIDSLTLGFMKLQFKLRFHLVAQEGVAIPSTRFFLPYGGDVRAFIWIVLLLYIFLLLILVCASLASVVTMLVSSCYSSPFRLKYVQFRVLTCAIFSI